uniref:Putative ZCF37 n=1 Tax=Tanacetum cinerariifolium TaxID=118510 RepID=A0A6L2L5N2_TANCI|nr:putative ZCF37 [Tanacetum cinerariifolium]
MCTSFICGSFNNQEEDDFEVLWPSPSTPSSKSRRHRFSCRSRKENKNPYANRGLDKFEALLADLEDKKQKIFTQKGSHYISFVRFVYSNSNDVKPIIVRLRDPRRHDKDHNHHKQINFKDTKSSPPPKLQASSLDHHQNLKPREDVMNGTMIEAQKAQHARPSINHVTNIIYIRVDQLKRSLIRIFEEWWMPSYNLPLFVIMVMVFLTFFGRSLAIVCTSIAWYMIPTIDGTLENTTTKPKKMIKNEHARKPSEAKMPSSPKAFLSGPINVEQKHKMKKLMSF